MSQALKERHVGQPSTQQRLEAPDRPRTKQRRWRSLIIGLVVLAVSAAIAVVVVMRAVGEDSGSDLAEVRQMAEEQGLTGLSPASLSSREDTLVRAGLNPTTSAEELEQLIRWAESEGMGGLSPASLYSP